jgi:hypothetical protein
VAKKKVTSRKKEKNLRKVEDIKIESRVQRMQLSLLKRSRPLLRRLNKDALSTHRTKQLVKINYARNVAQ